MAQTVCTFDVVVIFQLRAAPSPSGAQPLFLRSRFFCRGAQLQVLAVEPRQVLGGGEVLHGGELPALGMQKICMYSQDRGSGQVLDRLTGLLRAGFTGGESLDRPTMREVSRAIA